MPSRDVMTPAQKMAYASNVGRYANSTACHM